MDSRISAAFDPISPGVFLNGPRRCGGTEELSVAVTKGLCGGFAFSSKTDSKKDGQSCEENMGSCCLKRTLFSVQNHCAISASLENLGFFLDTSTGFTECGKLYPGERNTTADFTFWAIPEQSNHALTHGIGQDKGCVSTTC